MLANLSVAMGGRVAEEIIFGYDKVSSGASSDIEYATGLARDMVTRWGLSDKLGPLQYAEAEGETFLGYSQSRPSRVSAETAKLIDAEIKAIVVGAHEKAKQVLTDHVDQLHSLAAALLEFETLTGDEIKKLVAGEDIDRTSGQAAADAIPAAGSSIPKTKRPKGPFGTPSPAGA